MGDGCIKYRKIVSFNAIDFGTILGLQCISIDTDKNIPCELMVFETYFQNMVLSFLTKLQHKQANLDFFLNKWLQSRHLWPPFIFFRFLNPECKAAAAQF